MLHHQNSSRKTLVLDLDYQQQQQQQQAQPHQQQQPLPMSPRTHGPIEPGSGVGGGAGSADTIQRMQDCVLLLSNLVAELAKQHDVDIGSKLQAQQHPQLASVGSLGGIAIGFTPSQEETDVASVTTGGRGRRANHLRTRPSSTFRAPPGAVNRVRSGDLLKSDSLSLLSDRSPPQGAHLHTTSPKGVRRGRGSSSESSMPTQSLQGIDMIPSLRSNSGLDFTAEQSAAPTHFMSQSVSILPGVDKTGTLDSDPTSIDASAFIGAKKLELDLKNGFTERFDKRKLSNLTTRRDSSADGSITLGTPPMAGSAGGCGRMLDPDSIWMTSFETFGMACVMWDAFSLPWYLALYTDRDTWIWSWSWVPRLFWTMDILMNFFVSYTHPVSVGPENRTEIAVRYLRRWFAFDLCLVVADFFFAWLAFDLPSRNDESVLWHVYYVLVFLFLARMLRQAWRFPTFHEKFRVLARGQFGALAVFTDVFLVLSAILALNHLICCVWYLFGQDRGDTGHTWLTATHWHADASRRYEYWTALHWAFTQMTPGSMEVVPSNSGERAYTVIVLMVGLVVGPTLTASLTSFMTEKRLSLEEKTKRFAQLQQFLAQEDVDSRLCIIINRQVKQRLKEKQRIRLAEVKNLALISRGLRDELGYAVYGKRLMKHVFFHVLDIFERQALICLCSRTIVLVEQVSGDVVFEIGQQGDSMFFVQSGALQYQPGQFASETRHRALSLDLLVRADEWCSEAALWTNWVHLGTMRASGTTELLRISAKDLQRDLDRFPAAFAVTCEFGRAFVAYYRSADAKWSDIGHHIDHDDIFSQLSRETRIALAEPILDTLQVEVGPFSFLRGRDAANKIKRLREEISCGKCYIAINEGEVVRTVSVVALRVRSSEDPMVFLAQIAEKSGPELKVACELPGTKRKEQEAATAAMRRLIEEAFPSLTELVAVEQWVSESSQEMKHSQRFGIPTRYLRTTFDIEIEGDIVGNDEFITIDTPAEDFVPPELIANETTSARKLGLHRWSSCSECFSCICGCPRRQRSHRNAGDYISSLISAHNSSSTLTKSHRTTAAAKLKLEENVAQILRNKDCAVISPRKDGNLTVFLWLSQDEMELLSNTASQRILRSFVQQLDIKLPPGSVASDEAGGSHSAAVIGESQATAWAVEC